MNFFPKLVEHAHSVVQEAIKLVEEREAEYMRLENSKEVKTIRKIISYFIDRSDLTFSYYRRRQREVFQYFCASVIYAEIIKHSCLNQNGDLIFHKEISKKVSLMYLCIVAEKIHQKLIEIIHLHYGDKDEEQDVDPNEIESILEDRSGRLASRQSRGNIPFLTVYKGKSTSVSLRRGMSFI